MKGLGIFAFAGCFLFATASMAAESYSSYLITLKPHVSYTDFVFSQNCLEDENPVLSQSNVYQVRASAEEVRQFMQDPLVANVQEDIAFRVASTQLPVTPMQVFPQQIRKKVGLGLPRQDVDADIALIDTGVSHVDLKLHFSQSVLLHEAGAQDFNGHGTHQAGLMAARGQRSRILGMAPGARIWSVKAFDRSGKAHLSDLLRALQALLPSADELEVLHLGFEEVQANHAEWLSDDGHCGQKSQDYLHQMICRFVSRGVVVVAAAGNSKRDSASTRPAGYSQVLTVSAFDDFQKRFAEFSNYGRVVDLIAPGVKIMSLNKNHGLLTLSGSSPAAAFVSGSLAMMLSEQWKPRRAEEVLWVMDHLKSIADHRPIVGDPDHITEAFLRLRALQSVQKTPLVLQLHILESDQRWLRVQTQSKSGKILPHQLLTLVHSGVEKRKETLISDRQGQARIDRRGLSSILANGQVLWKKTSL